MSQTLPEMRRVILKNTNTTDGHRFLRSSIKRKAYENSELELAGQENIIQIRTTKEPTIPNTPHKSFAILEESPSIESRLGNASSAACLEGLKSPYKASLKSSLLLGFLGRRIYSSAKTSHGEPILEGLFAHTRNANSEDLEKLSSFDRDTYISKRNSFSTFHSQYFAATNSKVTSRTTFYPETGKKATLVTGITSYPKIAAELGVMSYKYLDADVASAIMDILNGRPVTIFDASAPTQCQKHKNFLTKICYLLFSTEANRLEAAAITNAMFLDLVKAGKYKMSDIAHLPLSSKGITKATKKFNKILEGVMPTSLKYDLSASSLLDVNDKMVQMLFEKHHKILQDWMALRYPAEASIQITLYSISACIEEWFGFTIKPFRLEDEDVIDERISMATPISDFSDDSSSVAGSVDTLGKDVASSDEW